MIILQPNKKELPTYFPIDAIINFMALLLINNVFQFGYTCWIHKKGTSMGTPLAVLYVNIVMGEQKNKC